MIRILTSAAALTLILAANGVLAADRLTDTQLDAVTAGLLPPIGCSGCSGRGTASTSSSSTLDGVTVTTDITEIISGGGGTGGGGTGALPTVQVPANLAAILAAASTFTVQLNH